MPPSIARDVDSSLLPHRNKTIARSEIDWQGQMGLPSLLLLEALKGDTLMRIDIFAAAFKNPCRYLKPLCLKFRVGFKSKKWNTQKKQLSLHSLVVAHLPHTRHFVTDCRFLSFYVRASCARENSKCNQRKQWGEHGGRARGHGVVEAKVLPRSERGLSGRRRSGPGLLQRSMLGKMER